MTNKIENIPLHYLKYRKIHHGNNSPPAQVDTFILQEIKTISSIHTT